MVRRTLVALLAIALGIATVPVAVAHLEPAPKHEHAAHHDPHGASVAQLAEKPCTSQCDCKGPLTAHCCAQAASAIASAAGLGFAIASTGTRSLVVRAVDEDAQSLHPPTPPPKRDVV